MAGRCHSAGAGAGAASSHGESGLRVSPRRAGEGLCGEVPGGGGQGCPEPAAGGSRGVSGAQEAPGSPKADAVPGQPPLPSAWVMEVALLLFSVSSSGTGRSRLNQP